MSERLSPPQRSPEAVNTYGTDDPAKQAEIEVARTAAAEERRANREKLERYVGYGLSEEDAAGLIEHEQALKDRRDAIAAGNPEKGEAERRLPPRVYVRSVVDHNEGHEIGDWVDASKDLEDVQADVRTILSRSLHTHWTDEAVEKWEIVNTERFGGIKIKPDESLDVVCALGKGIAEHGQAFAAWAEMNATLDLYSLERFPAAYFGDFKSREAYAEHVFDEMEGGRELAALPDWMTDIVRPDFEYMVHEMWTSGEVRFADHPDGVWVFNGRV